MTVSIIHSSFKTVHGAAVDVAPTKGGRYVVLSENNSEGLNAVSNIKN